MPINFENIQLSVSNSSLDLNNRGLCDDDIIVICTYLTQNPKIIEIDLSDNKIGAEGAKALAKITTLKTLFMDNNEIGDEGAEALVNSSVTKFLCVSNNKIGDRGVKALANNLTVEMLDVDGNEISLEASAALKRRTALIDDRHVKKFLKEMHEDIDKRLEETRQEKEQQEEKVVLGRHHREFNHAISILQKKKMQFCQNANFETDSKLQEAHKAVEKLYIALENEGTIFFSKIFLTRKEYQHFALNCKQHIVEARKILDSYRGWGIVLLNIFSMIITAGIGYAVAAGINIAINGRFTFFNTDTSEKLYKIEENIENLREEIGWSR